MVGVDLSSQKNIIFHGRVGAGGFKDSMYGLFFV